MARRPNRLEPDEPLLARAPVSFRGATAASVRSTFALRSAQRRNGAYLAWRANAETVGFDTERPEMVLGLTETCLVVWTTTFWLGRPGAITAKLPLSAIGDVATVRHGLVTGLALAFTNGQIIEVEAMRGRRLRHFAHALRTEIASGPGSRPGDRFKP